MEKMQQKSQGVSWGVGRWGGEEQWTTPGTGLQCEILNDVFRQPESPEHTEWVVKH